MSKEEIEEIETLEIDFKDTDELELVLEVSSKKAIYLIDDLIKHLFELQQENQSLKKENKILRENAEHNDKVLDKINWENQKLKKELEEANEKILLLQASEPMLEYKKALKKIDDLEQQMEILIKCNDMKIRKILVEQLINFKKENKK